MMGTRTSKPSGYGMKISLNQHSYASL
jgi:hypothetical protein